MAQIESTTSGRSPGFASSIWTPQSSAKREPITTSLSVAAPDALNALTRGTLG
jgi:hypothetical protein